MVGAWSAATLYCDYFLVSSIIHFRDDSLFLLMFLTPFNMIMLFLVWMFIKNSWKPDARLLPEIEETADRVRIRLGPTPGTVAALTFAVANGIGAVVIPLCLCGDIASVPTWCIAWAVVFLLTAYSYLHVTRLRRRGYYDITLDLISKTLTLPPMITKSENWVIPFADISSIRVIEWTDNEQVKRYRATIHWTDSQTEARHAIMTDSSDQSAVEMLVACIQADVTRTIEMSRNRKIE